MVDTNAYRNWTQASQDRALDLLAEHAESTWRPFYCPDRHCDGKPHGTDDGWDFPHARSSQRPPAGDSWLTWASLGGRGSGKTRGGSEWVHRLAKKFPGCRIALISPTGPEVRETIVEGEALALDTPVPSPDGWTTMGALKVGDIIYGGNGLPCRVTEAFPVMHDRPCYNVTVEGVSVVADANHKWVTSTHLERSYGYRDTYPKDRYEGVRTTEEMHATSKTENGFFNSQHAIAAVTIEGREVDLPVDPYALGYWLGDGTKRSAYITSHPDDQRHVREFIEEAGYTTRVSYGQDGRGFTFLVEGLSKDLLKANLLRNKHVPEIYYSASLEQRLALLQGLMDSDGTISRRGQVEFSNKDPNLIRAVFRLMGSLGIKARIVIRESGQGRVRATASVPMFRLPRKAERVPAWRSERDWRYVTGIEHAPSVPVRCISVDSSDRTFLVTEQYVRTHNSGLLNTSEPGHYPDWEPSKKKLTWPNGSTAYGYSGEEPDRLRGKQHHFGWLDEPAHIPLIDEVWSNFLFGLRLGKNPHALCTTSPLPVKWLKELLADEHTVTTRATTYDNLDNLPPHFRKIILARYEGTRLGRQEIMGELLDELEGALWNTFMIDESRDEDTPEIVRLCIGVDPAGTAGKRSDETGIVLAGVDEQDEYHVLEDHSGKFSPEGWARKVLDLARERKVDALVVEITYGRDMVLSVLNNALRPGEIMPKIITVDSRRGKQLRAEPVVALYERGKVHHGSPGDLEDLENQMVTWIPGKGNSPDRVDALVHVITHLAVRVEPGSVTSPASLLRGRSAYSPAAHARMAS